MSSFFRPAMATKPSLEMVARSPVRNQPSGRGAAGEKPAVGRDGAGLLPRLEIPLHDGGAPDPELARLARASRVARVVPDAQPAARCGPAPRLGHGAPR